MPNWKFHNNWAEGLGIPRYLANWVNKREDMPKIEKFDDPELQEQKESMPDYQPTYDEMAQKGPEYLRAWILHLALDEIENTASRELKEIADKHDEEDGIDGREAVKIKKIITCAVIATITGDELLRLIPDDILDYIIPNLGQIIEELPCLSIEKIIDVVMFSPEDEEVVTQINCLHRPSGVINVENLMQLS